MEYDINGKKVSYKPNEKEELIVTFKLYAKKYLKVNDTDAQQVIAECLYKHCDKADKELIKCWKQEFSKELHDYFLEDAIRGMND